MYTSLLKAKHVFGEDCYFEHNFAAELRENKEVRKEIEDKRKKLAERRNKQKERHSKDKTLSENEKLEKDREEEKEKISGNQSTVEVLTEAAETDLYLDAFLYIVKALIQKQRKTEMETQKLSQKPKRK